MSRAALLLPLMLVLTACEPEQHPTTWVGLVDKWAIFIFLLLMIGLGAWRDRGRKS